MKGNSDAEFDRKLQELSDKVIQLSGDLDYAIALTETLVTLATVDPRIGKSTIESLKKIVSQLDSAQNIIG